MTKLVALFPGQGSQAKGMSITFCQNFDYVNKLFQEASTALGYDMYTLIADDSDGKLNSTEYTQPALLLASYSAYTVAKRELGVAPLYVAGHSLGEYTALVAAGVLTFSDALRLVARRGQLMQQAVPDGSGAMAAVIGLDAPVLEELCQKVPTGYVTCANYNSPGQIVVSGDLDGVEALIKSAKAAGAKLAKRLAVSVPSHCNLMREASETFETLLNQTAFELANIPIVNNVDATLHTEPDVIRTLLAQQLYSPVFWTQTIQLLIGEGVRMAIEFGPGKVLTGLNRRIAKELDSRVLQSMDDLTELSEVFA